MTEYRAGSCTIQREGAQAAVGCVNVIIAARNRAVTIERAVRSALEQAEVRTVIVVDDASDDDTTTEAERCDPGGRRLIVKHLSANLGPSAARNIAIEISKAPWLAILDGDDYFLPGRLSTLLSFADDWDFVADNILQMPDHLPDAERSAPTLLGSSAAARSVNLEQFVLGNLPRHDCLRKELSFLKPLIRRDFLKSRGLRYDERLRLGEDYALYAHALAVGARFFIHPAAGYVSLIRTDSLSARHDRQDLQYLRDFDCELLSLATRTPAERRAVAKHYASVDCRVQWLTVIEAVKTRSVFAALPAFFRSPTVTLFLLRRLAKEFTRRTLMRFAIDNDSK